MAEEAKHSGNENAVVPAQSHGNVGVAAGTAVISSDAVENPGLPAHRQRITDLDPRREKSAERTVYLLFYVSIAGSIGAMLAYMFFPIESGDLWDIRLHTMFVGLGMTLGLLGAGIAAVHWGKTLIVDHEIVDERHPVASSDEVRKTSGEIFKIANEESGFSRRTLVRNSLLGALIAFPIPGITLLRGLAPQDLDPVELLRHTMWEKGTRLSRDLGGSAVGAPIKASEVTIGSVFHVVPENLGQAVDVLNEKAKAIVLLIRLDPAKLHEPEDRKDWSHDGIVAYSKVCTHVGCPVALNEQHTHHLLCPCHQSQFDVSDQAKVVFGPAKRPLPQLPIEVDDEGYLVAKSDFTEPVGPSYWERLK